MFRTIVVAWIAFTISSQRMGLAQELVPSIEFSAEEATQAKQGAQDLKTARERNTRAELAWKMFRETFQAEHPELPMLQFTSDFRRAVVIKKGSFLRSSCDFCYGP